LTFLSHKIFQ
jgi:hypothetical protein